MNRQWSQDTNYINRCNRHARLYLYICFIFAWCKYYYWLAHSYASWVVCVHFHKLICKNLLYFSASEIGNIFDSATAAVNKVTIPTTEVAPPGDKPREKAFISTLFKILIHYGNIMILMILHVVLFSDRTLDFYWIRYICWCSIIHILNILSVRSMARIENAKKSRNMCKFDINFQLFGN